MTISLLFERINDTHFSGITVMDGKFFSLYPRDIINNIFTLTDVEYTPLIIANTDKDFNSYIINDKKEKEIKTKMINKVKEYYSEFENNFSYKGYFISRKVKYQSATDSRDICINNSNNVINVTCGKIYGIFDLEKYIKEILFLL